MTVSQATDEARIGSSPRMDLLRRAVCIASVAGLCSMMGSLMAGCSEPDPFDVFWLEPDGSALVVDLPPGRVDPPMPDVGPDGPATGRRWYSCALPALVRLSRAGMGMPALPVFVVELAAFCQDPGDWMNMCEQMSAMVLSA